MFSDTLLLCPAQAASSSLLPAEGEHLQEQLDVVTVTRSVKKPKKKRSKKSRSSGGEGSSDGEPSDGRHVVLQVEAEAGEGVSEGELGLWERMVVAVDETRRLSVNFWL